MSLQTNTEFGYIYIRQHESYLPYNACKLGKTTNIPERDIQYATGEIKRGIFSDVWVVPKKHTNCIENLLHYQFNKYNIKIDAGIEYYDKIVINMIDPYLSSLSIEYKKLSTEQINELVKPNRKKIILKRLKDELLRLATQRNKYNKRDYQENIINKACQYFSEHNKGMLCLPCGVGKTLISLWIAEKSISIDGSIIIGVPNRLLLGQFLNKTKDLFNTQNILCVDKSKNVSDIENLITKYKDEQKTIYKQKLVIITTYASCYKVKQATDNLQFTFDIKINDEVHHLTSVNMDLNLETKQYIEMLKISAKKQLSLTATLKILENQTNKPDEDIVISNDNQEYFGNIIDKRTLLWAITNQIICDYIIQTIVTDSEKLEEQLVGLQIFTENDKRLFLSAYSSLKSIAEGHSHHLLIYANNIENATKLCEYIQLILDEGYFKLPGLFFSIYNSEMKKQIQKNVLNKFEKSKYGIMTCVYCLGEGWDLPLLDGVVFGENMSSNIRIVQSALRACRKNISEPNKIMKIILPIINKDEWISDGVKNYDLDKVCDIIYQMGLEDELISQKITVSKISVLLEKDLDESQTNDKQMIEEFGEYDEELTQKLRLKTTKRTILTTTYEKAKKIIQQYQISNKEEYKELCMVNNKLPLEPEIQFKTHFTNWIDYLGIKRVYYDLETCKQKILEYLEQYHELKEITEMSKICGQICAKDSNFPPNGLWVEYYDVVDINEIIILPIKRKITEYNFE